jgi:hypothetical protein
MAAQVKRAQDVCSSLQSKPDIARSLPHSLVGDGEVVITEVLDTWAADDVTRYGTHGLEGFAGGPQLGVSSTGTIYVVVPTLDASLALHQEVVAVVPGAAPRRVLVASTDKEFIRALFVVRVDARGELAGPPLVRDQLFLIVDGFDPVAGAGWRQFRTFDPAVDVTEVLFHQRLARTRLADTVLGTLRSALSQDGVLYVMEEFHSAVEHPGSIRAFVWDAPTRRYVERAEPITRPGTVTGSIAAGPDGCVYGFAREPGADASHTRRVLRIDPRRPEVPSLFATLGPDLGARPVDQTDLMFDAWGNLWLRTEVQDGGGHPRGLVVPVTAGTVAQQPLAHTTAGTPLLGSMFAAGPRGELYVVERRHDAGLPYPDLDLLVQIAPLR